MPKYEKFEDLPVWQQASRLYNRVQDFLENPKVPVSRDFRAQLDRATLSVSNNIAEGFERATTAELLSFLAIARGSSGEVRSMTAIIKDRPGLKLYHQDLQEIRAMAESCCKQLGAWISAIDNSLVQGKRHLDWQGKEARRLAQAAKDFRLRFLRNLKPNHALYTSAEARAARGEVIP